MLRCLQICIFIFLALLSCESFAQDIVPKSDGDTKYREDQFYIGVTYNLISDVPSGVQIRGLSGGLQFGYLRDMPINKRRSLAIAVGAGLAFNVYSQLLFIGEAPDGKTIFTVLDDQNVDFTRNSFNTSTLEVPIEFRWRSSTAETYQFWRIYAGFKIGYAYWYKSTFKQTGNNVTQTDIPEFQKLRLGASLTFGYNSFNFIASYSINPFFKDAMTTDGQEVNFRTIQVGIVFYIL
jgi:hypothetical protein